MIARPSLSRRVALFTTLGLAVIWAAAVGLMSMVMWSEQDELFDQQLVETAHIMLPLLSRMEDEGVTEDPSHQPASLDEALIYRLFSGDGMILRQSLQASQVALPAPGSAKPGKLVTTADYRIYTTPLTPQGRGLQIGAPLAERREAFREAMIGFLLPMIALLPLTWMLITLISRRALAPLRALGKEIADRDGSRLDAIDAKDWPEDLRQIAGAVNGFMARLSQALEAERAFATNAAHELRTPVAIALAQTQQLRENANPAQSPRLDAIERALQRMRKLVARLLQLARADAGIGQSAAAYDLVTLTRLTINELATPDTVRLQVDLPSSPVMSRIDPDAYAIILSNLIDNALQHSPPCSPVQIQLSAAPTPTLEVMNQGEAVPALKLQTLTHRFQRNHGKGFGLGLHICQQIVTAAGGELQMISPVPPLRGGFAVRVTLPWNRSAQDVSVDP